MPLRITAPKRSSVAAKTPPTRRSGTSVVVDEAGALLGIFTHGDFGRHFRQHPDLLEQPVSKFMTQRPITIGAEKLAVEVLHLFEQHRIDDLVVLEEGQRPIGVVDSQDLARFKLI